jgi:iron complex transport system ATP-binding protein
MSRPADGREPHGDGLRGDGLTVRYQKRPPVIRDQSLAIPKGHITAFIGPNGSGKSTLLKTLARQLHPGSGTVILDGKDIISLTGVEMARRLGMLFQENIAPNDLTVEELACHGRYPHRRLFESFSPEDFAAIDQALELSGAGHLRHRPISQLSSGQKQLAWIAMLLAQSPAYMFLDEPTTFLDMAHQFDVMDLIRRLNRQLGTTVVLSVHDLNLAARYADHILAVRDGVIVADGTPAAVLTAETLRRVFQVDARIIDDPALGGIFCVPLGRHPAGERT